MEYYVSVILIAVSSVLSCFAGLPMIKIIQLSGYRARGVKAWWKGSKMDVIVRYASLMLFSFIAMIVYTGCFGTFAWARYCAPALYAVIAAVFIYSAGKSGDNGVVPTGRAVRLVCVNMILSLGLGALVAWASYYDVYFQTLTAALAAFIPLSTLAANFITYPFENLNNKKYVKMARAALDKKSPVVIGITGSFGKTSAKNMLKAMLERKYTVLATPGNYNTPMGICKTVNGMLADEQVFIAELGARYKGDVKELCGIVRPKYGIITAVGDMHIETMGSRAGVADVKYELGTALPADGLLVLNGYNLDCKALYDRASACRKHVTGEDDAVKYDKLVIDGGGTAFELVINGAAYPVKTSLLGAHIPELACVCAALATELGVAPEDIVSAIESMPQVEHRLQLIPSADPAVTVIDDAYNSNPVGAKNALEVLGMFDGKKIIITPGFVELGAIEKDCNRTFGAQIAAVCDYAFLVGSRAEDIKKGALLAGMNEGTISTFPCRDDAVKALAEITGQKTVLFANDLPDNIK